MMTPKERFEAVKPVIRCTGDSDITALAKFLNERIRKPESYVTLLGETSSGKSTLLNGLIGDELLVVKASPATGTITEIELCDGLREPEFYRLNKNGSMQNILPETFRELSLNPDAELMRLKLKTGNTRPSLASMRIFDTPGYNSIVSEHEEILKNFIPESDVVLYVISYRVGIQNDDFAFLGFLSQLVHDGVEVAAVINRCPPDLSENDRRVAEISQYLEMALHKEAVVLTVKNEPAPVETDNAHPLPPAENVWEHISGAVNSDERRARLDETLNGYVDELFTQCYKKLSARYASYRLNEEKKREFEQAQRETAEELKAIIPELIVPTFDKLINAVDKSVEDIVAAVEAKLCGEIDDMKSPDYDAMIQYINAHALPFAISVETDEYKHRIEVVLDDLNARIDDRINKALGDFSTKVSFIFSSDAELAVKNIAGKLGGKIAENLLGKLFAQFGGAGGANAGIANAASHLLKKIGDVFGKTFSRETHNTLKHVLAKMGATSMRAVGMGITVIIELVGVVVDFATWKSKLKKKIGKSLKIWKEETIKPFKDSLAELRDTNIETINAIIKENLTVDLSSDELGSEQEALADLELAERVGKEIGAVL